MVLDNAVELNAVEGAGEWLLEARIQHRVVGYIGENPLLGTYRYYRGVDGMLAHEANDLDALIRWVAHKP
jgi:hypothetical protein